MAEPTRRVRIFVDFWNFQINWNAYQGKAGATPASPVPIPWKDLAGVFVAEIALAVLARGLGVEMDAKARRKKVLEAIAGMDHSQTKKPCDPARLIREDRSR